jgi:tetratricopeptide (TPR) repeat protein/predicted Ser/Thr protein kinase
VSISVVVPLFSEDEATVDSGPCPGLTAAAIDETLPLGGRGDERHARGASIGRYIVVDYVGEGSMGVVYRAYDPELDRSVAIKLVHIAQHGGSGVDSQVRLVREAQALARVSHPNVISVFDAGTVGNDVFVAMEYVEGKTLRAWLEDEPRSRDEVLRVLAAAGQGLAAAHRAGLVHRDFKPDNVVVGDNGRVRVLDFGLACAAKQRNEGRLCLVPPDATPRHLDLELTQNGTIIGTPAYMAPEQRRAGRVDERSDQFSFCVTLCAALTGERPEVDCTGLDPIVHIDESIRELPAHLRRLIERGLSVIPADRHPDMDTLLVELQRRPDTRRKQILLGIGAIVMAFALVVIAMRAGDDDRTVCSSAGYKLGETWNTETKTAMKAAFLGTGRPHAADTYQRVERVLDRYSRRWTAMRTDACEATHVRGEQSEHLLDTRMQCLDRRQAEMSALTSLFSRSLDGDMLDEAVAATLQLTPIEACADMVALTAAVPPPEDPSERAAVASLVAGLDDVQAQTRAGRYREALVAAKPIADNAEHIGHAPLRAKALFAVGTLQTELGHAEPAERNLYAAARAGAAARDDVLVARSWIALIGLLGNDPARAAEALALRPVAETALERLPADATPRADLLRVVAVIHDARDEHRQARALLEDALAIVEADDDAGDLELASVLHVLGNTLQRLGDHVVAESYLERVVAILERTLGDDHPATAQSHSSLGAVYHSLARYDEARSHLTLALAGLEKAFGPEDMRVASVFANLALVAWSEGNADEAQRHYDRALAIQEADGDRRGFELASTPPWDR